MVSTKLEYARVQEDLAPGHLRLQEDVREQEDELTPSTARVLLCVFPPSSLPGY